LLCCFSSSLPTVRPRVAWGVGVQAPRRTAVIDGQAGRRRVATQFRLTHFTFTPSRGFRTEDIRTTLHSHAREFTVLALPSSTFTLLGSNPPYLAISYVAKY